jgi:dienelactone hydrolase
MAANGSRITLDVNDGTRMGAYVSRPAGAGPHRGVLVIQDALGVNAHFREMCDRYAALGFVAIAPDMFHRTSPGFEADTRVMEQVMPLIKSLTTDGLLADVTAAHRWITTEGGVASERVGAVGFCLGGRAVFLANSALPLGAAISYYGGSIAPASWIARPPCTPRTSFSGAGSTRAFRRSSGVPSSTPWTRRASGTSTSRSPTRTTASCNAIATTPPPRISRGRWDWHSWKRRWARDWSLMADDWLLVLVQPAASSQHLASSAMQHHSDSLERHEPATDHRVELG